ncbi:MAG: histidine phosphatase family protein [Candidatus Omnitrophica bacterium]|nr:histidine phosphatase family protein [Candidatus Omnitrophota bacterium]MDD5237594.1 histidine phosphatase family protein [Candidatus Omnitrophota bacterium]
MPTKLILIRHGQTAWNLQKRYCGLKDIGLSYKGKKQVLALRNRLAGEKIHKIYSSDKKRTIQTAKIIFQGSSVEKITDLREMNFGCFEGFTHREITKIYPGVYQRWLKDPFSTAVPGGERLINFKKRVVRALKKIIIENKNMTTAVVCHGGVISIFLTSILKSKDFWGQIPGAASLSIVEFSNGKAEIKLFNDIAHLNG